MTATAPIVKTRPIIFRAESVRAILAGRKTQTRRVVGPGNSYVDGYRLSAARWAAHNFDFSRARVDSGPSPAGNPGPYLKVPALHDRDEFVHRVYPQWEAGDRLWVREAFRLRADQDAKPPSQDWWKSGAWYAADPDSEPSGCPGGAGKLRSPIHMPRWASRLTLEITGIRVERLQQITDADILAEGVWWELGGSDDVPVRMRPRFALEYGWNRINGKRPGCAWADDPYVWVLHFRRVEP